MNDLWRTPKEVFHYFNEQYGFVCDVAASDHNHLCDEYLTEEINALTLDWGASINSCKYGDYVWCNPPYSKPLPWVQKCIDESIESGIGSVMLLNHDMTTKWAALLLSVQCEIIVLTGARIAFLDANGKPIKGNPKGQVIFIIPPYVRWGNAKTTYLKLKTVMEHK